MIKNINNRSTVRDEIFFPLAYHIYPKIGFLSMLIVAKWSWYWTWNSDIPSSSSLHWPLAGVIHAAVHYSTPVLGHGFYSNVSSQLVCLLTNFAFKAKLLSAVWRITRAKYCFILFSCTSMQITFNIIGTFSFTQLDCHSTTVKDVGNVLGNIKILTINFIVSQ